MVLLSFLHGLEGGTESGFPTSAVVDLVLTSTALLKAITVVWRAVTEVTTE